ncbi:MAG TPA: helix-turn-helix domain-containing protein, partial [Dongiaceae bacterium]|nr:helix-turn-helix domain-containing protein [Dongiaceae bacterium]
MQPSQRKQPRQTRAQNTVSRILEATALIIEKEGLDAATTNRIAQKAHVNISSLYQYFSNREAIFLAVLQQHFDAIFIEVDYPTLTRELSVVQAARESVLAALRYLRSHSSSLTLLLWSLKQPVLAETNSRVRKRGSEEFRRLLVKNRDMITAPD